MDVPRLNFNPCHVAILEGSHVAAMSRNVGMSLSEFCLIIRAKNHNGCLLYCYRRYQNGWKECWKIGYCIFIFSSNILSAPSYCRIFKRWNLVSLSNCLTVTVVQSPAIIQSVVAISFSWCRCLNAMSLVEIHPDRGLVVWFIRSIVTIFSAS